MGKNLAEKIIAAHLVEGEMAPGSEIALRIDQTLTQDATGTMSYLQFEALGIPRSKSKLSVSYVDHITLQNSYKTPTIDFAELFKKYGLYFSWPGNGICHQVHLERFANRRTLLGAAAIPTAGSIGILAISAGGLMWLSLWLANLLLNYAGSNQ